MPNLSRSVGATVILVDGEMTAYLSRGDREIVVHLPDDEPARSRRARAAAAQIAAFAKGDVRGRRPMLIARINDQPALDHPFAPFLEEAGFVRGGPGFYLRRPIGEPDPTEADFAALPLDFEPDEDDEAAPGA